MQTICNMVLKEGCLIFLRSRVLIFDDATRSRQELDAYKMAPPFLQISQFYRYLTYLESILEIWPVYSIFLLPLIINMSLPFPNLHPLVAELAAELFPAKCYQSLGQEVQEALDQGVDELREWNITSDINFLQFASDLLTKWVPSANTDET